MGICSSQGRNNKGDGKGKKRSVSYNTFVSLITWFLFAKNGKLKLPLREL